MKKEFNQHTLNEEGEPILTPLQQAEKIKLTAQQEAVKQIKKILEDNGLELFVSHTVQLVPKK